MTYKEILALLTSVPTISGQEDMAGEAVKAAFSEHFDEIYTDKMRNTILVKRGANSTGKKIVLDAHMDQIGLMVKEITSSGKLKMAPVGGFDRKILPASEVTVYGKRALHGVFAVPKSTEEKDAKAPSWDELLLDIGYDSAEEAGEVVSIGDVATYYYKGDELLGNRITGVAFDDKACGAALIKAVMDIPASELCYDVYVTLSSAEETGGGGAKNAVYAIEPDIAIVTDVNFARTPGVEESESGELGGGPMISLSAVTDRALTRRIISLAKENNIPHSPVVEATSTGTNASHVYYVKSGVPCAVVSLPLGGMHSYNETLDTRDADNFALLIGKIITTDMEA